MQKKELTSLISKMCKELLVIIDEQEEEATLAQVSAYLQESAELIKTTNEDQINNSGYIEALFHNAYEEIAKKSLSSYKKTTQKIEELTLLHKSTLSECSGNHIDIPNITNKFNEIQTHMTDEVTKANDVISKLMKQVRTLEEKTNIDSLTKIFNRRALTTYLDNLCSNKKPPFNFHILVIDIDDFKVINDTHGHIAGDKVLIYMANILKKTLRDGDKVFRFGGEEFVVSLNRINDEHCIKATNRLLDLIRNNKLIYKNKTLHATVSIGATKFMQGDTPDSLLARADKALYIAKQNGKDQLHTEVLNGL
jgi:diguanylate cyclase (GGDEF)-like protein